jgi:hypothetical protein
MEDQNKTNDTWQNVGKQFEQLGKSLEEAFDTAWNDDNNREKLKELEIGVINVLDKITTSIKEEVESPKGQETIQDIKKGLEKAAASGEKLVENTRPQLEEALVKVNQNIQDWINRMNNKAS